MSMCNVEKPCCLISFFQKKAVIFHQKSPNIQDFTDGVGPPPSPHENSQKKKSSMPKKQGKSGPRLKYLHLPAQTVAFSFKSRFRSPDAASLYQVRERACTGPPI